MGDASWIVTCMKDILNNNKMLSLTMIEERRFSKRIAHAGLEWVYESWGLLDVGEFGEGRVSNTGRIITRRIRGTAIFVDRHRGQCSDRIVRRSYSLYSIELCAKLYWIRCCRVANAEYTRRVNGVQI
jgi:hypothetical protein